VRRSLDPLLLHVDNPDQRQFRFGRPASSCCFSLSGYRCCVFGLSVSQTIW